MDEDDPFKELGGHDMILARLAHIVRSRPGIAFEVAWRYLETQLPRETVLAIVIETAREGHPDAVEPFEHEGQMHFVSAADNLDAKERVAAANRNTELAIAWVLVPALRLRTPEIVEKLVNLGWERSAEQVRYHLRRLVDDGKVIREGLHPYDLSTRNYVYHLHPEYAGLLQNEAFKKFELRFLGRRLGPDSPPDDTPSPPDEESPEPSEARGPES